MNDINKHLQDISEIRSMMERSSKFLSLSGLSGISAGIIGTAGSFIAYWFLNNQKIHPSQIYQNIIFFLFLAISMLILAIGFSILFSIRMAKKKNLPIWNKTTKYMLINLFIPLITGGLFCFILAYHGILYLIAPVTLLFYGLALLNASKYTVKEIQYLAFIQILLGLCSSIWINYSLFFWGFGFGLLHIIYGIIAYYKYEK